MATGPLEPPVQPAAKPDVGPPSDLPIVSGKLLSGAEGLFDDQLHVGMAIEVKASGEKAYVMIPDVVKIADGEPIYITAPVKIRGEHFRDYLKSKNVDLDGNPAGRLLSDLSVTCEAFYYSKAMVKLDTQAKVDAYNNVHKFKDGDPEFKKFDATKPPAEVDSGALLMVFEVNTDKGVIASLSGDEHLGKLFDVMGVTMRVLRCSSAQRPVLERYVRQLQGG